MPHRHRFLLVIACACTMFATAARATQVVHLDTRALTHESSDIVIGTVTAQKSYWNAAHTRILTDVTIQVTESLKGVPAGELTLTQLGGELDGMRYNVPGSPTFKVGEEALVFAWRDSKGTAQVDGLAQGKFEIERDAASGARTVQRAGVGLAAADAKTLKLAPSGHAQPQLKLDDMIREIKAAMAEAGR
jgi:hypothetical protein